MSVIGYRVRTTHARRIWIAGPQGLAMRLGISSSLVLAWSILITAVTAMPGQAAPAVSAVRGGRVAPLTSYAVNGYLTGVAAISARDVWAVGVTGTKTLVTHWNGHGWTRTPSPSPGTGSHLYDVAGTSARNVWAVGGSGNFPDNKTLILHWNGHQWKKVPSPSPDAVSNGNYAEALLAVAAVSATNAWAAGVTGSGTTLVLHWNGRTWTRVPSPAQGSLDGISAVSARDIWATGEIGETVPLILHWNGAHWARVRTPAGPAGEGLVEDDIATASARRAWTVGSVGLGTGIQILAWNGARWRQAPVPGLSPRAGLLEGVAAVSAGNAWAVGYRSTPHSTFAVKNLIVHWNGKKWAVVSCPAPRGSTLTAVAAASARSAWAVGNTNSKTMILHWNGTSWH